MNTRPLLVILAAALTGAEVRAQTACSASAFGPLSQDPITITGPWTIGNNCSLNFGSRHVILAPTAALSVTNATVLAGQFTMQPAATISSTPTGTASITITALSGATATGDISIGGIIDVSSTAMGGVVSITASGVLSITGPGASVDAHGITSGSQGGVIALIGSTSLIIGTGTTVDARGLAANGGFISVQSLGSITMGGSILASGTQTGGQVLLDAATTLTSTGTIEVTGTFDDAAASPGATGGTITMIATQSATIMGSLLGSVAPSVAAFGLYDSVAGVVSLWAGGDLDLNALVDLRSLHRFGQAGSFVAHSGGRYRQLGGSILADTLCNYFACHSSGGTIAITSSGDSILQAYNTVSGAPDSCDDEGPQGLLTVTAGGLIDVSGSLQAWGVYGSSYPPPPNGIYLTSQGNDIQVSGTLDTTSWSHGPAATQSLIAARDVDISGTILANVGGFCGFGPEAGHVIVQAGRHVNVSGSVQATGGSTSGTIDVTACKVLVSPTATITADFSSVWPPGGAGGTINVVSGDLLEIHGSMSSVEPFGPAVGTITLTTRLGSPYSPVLPGASINPAPVIVHNNTLSPCLALLTATLIGPSPLNPGDTFMVDLNSVPSRPIVVLADFSLQHVSLGILGWTQVNPFGSAAILADAGALGPPLPGSMTDATGHWGFSFPTTGLPGLSGLTVFVEAYVIDPAAANGLFHQPPYLAVQFQ